MYTWILICLAIYAMSIMGMFVITGLGMKLKFIDVHTEWDAAFMAWVTLVPIANTVGIIVMLVILLKWLFFNIFVFMFDMCEKIYNNLSFLTTLHKKLAKMYLSMRDNNS